MENEVDRHETAKIIFWVSLIVGLINGYSHGNPWVSVILYIVFMGSLFAQG